MPDSIPVFRRGGLNATEAVVIVVAKFVHGRNLYSRFGYDLETLPLRDAPLPQYRVHLNFRVVEFKVGNPLCLPTVIAEYMNVAFLLKTSSRQLLHFGSASCSVNSCHVLRLFKNLVHISEVAATDLMYLYA